MKYKIGEKNVEFKNDIVFKRKYENLFVKQ